MHRGGGGSTFSSSMLIDERYGNTFGYRGVPYNSYLYNAYYRDRDSLKDITSSLFYGPKVNNREKEQFYRQWNDENDKKWRETTRAPYFENKIPGDQKILPASAVLGKFSYFSKILNLIASLKLGAAVAFGIVSLLPLDIPPGKPLMYCGNTDLHQSQIRINNQDIFVCNNKNIEVLRKNSEDEKCSNEILQCGMPNAFNYNIYCSDGALLSSINLFCNSIFTINGKNTKKELTVINCYNGQLPRSEISFVPTSTTTEWPFFTTTPKPLSFNANLHLTFLKLLGKSDALQTTTPETFPYTDSIAWRPEALMVTTESTTMRPTRSTTNRPYVWMDKEYIYHENGTVETTFRSIPRYLQEDESGPFFPPPNWYKFYTTTTEPVTTTTTTEAPYVWMRKISSNNNYENFEPIPKIIIDLAGECSPFYPSNWAKIPEAKV